MQLKDKLKANKLTIGAWSSIPSPLSAEAMASLGFDWLAIDMEHGTTGVDAASHIFAAIEKYKIAPLVRIPCHKPVLTRRLMDAGAHGVIVPVVEDADIFKDFVSHMYYPPEGRRGVGLSRCNLWGDNFKEYLENFKPVVIAQIETRKGAENAEKIAAIPGVDGLFLGPYDLSADLGTPGNFETPEFLAARDKIKQACANQNKIVGIHQVEPDPDKLEQRIAEGFRFIAYATDIIALRHALAQGLKTCRQKE